MAIGGIGGSLVPFSAGPDISQQPTDLEMQSFLSVLKRIAQGVGKGVDAGRQLGLLSDDPMQAAAAAAGQPSDLEMQGFLSVLKEDRQDRQHRRQHRPPARPVQCRPRRRASSPIESSRCRAS